MRGGRECEDGEREGRKEPRGYREEKRDGRMGEGILGGSVEEGCCCRYCLVAQHVWWLMV